MIVTRLSLRSSRCFLSQRGARFSSNEAEQASTLMLEGSASETLGEIIRHGRGDGVITLNVGGKSFDTLMSSVASNSVLGDHVARALRNREQSEAGAIFIDRDPTHFGFILQYLRNRAEFINEKGGSNNCEKLSAAVFNKFCRSHTNLPKDDKALRELYIEATYYRVEELQSILTEKSYLTKLLRFVDGNPFDAAQQTMSRLRAWLLTLTTLSATGVTVTISRDVDAFLKFIGWRDKNAPVPDVPTAA